MLKMKEVEDRMSMLVRGKAFPMRNSKSKREDQYQLVSKDVISQTRKLVQSIIKNQVKKLKEQEVQSIRTK